MILIIKLILFYGGAFVCCVAGLLLVVFRPPRLHVRLIGNEAKQMIRCTFRVSRTFSPIYVKGIWIPTEYAQILGASPPAGFEEQVERRVPEFLIDGEQREVVVWAGRLHVPKGQIVDVDIPAKHPVAVSATLVFFIEYRGVAGVGIIGGAPSYATIEAIKPNAGL